MIGKKIGYFLLGGKKAFSLEKRILHAAILASILIQSVWLVETFIYNRSKGMLTFLVLSIVAFLVQYIFSRYKDQKYWPVWMYVFLSFALILTDWLFLGAEKGLSCSLLIALPAIIPFVLRKDELKYGNIFTIVFYITIVITTILFHKQIEEDGEGLQVGIVVVKETLILSVLMLVIGNVVVKAHRRGRSRVIELNEKLHNSNTEIRLRNEMLKELDDSKNKFFNIIAHDLRGPLGTMYSANEVLLSQYSQIDEESRKELLISLSETSKNTYALLENLLEWSKAESGAMQIKEENHKAKEVVVDVINLLMPMYNQKKVELKSNVSVEYLYADKNVVQTILRNFLSNALKFTPSNKEVLVTVKNNGDAAVFVVKDQGVGMNNEVKENLFQIENKSSLKGTHNEKGSGLGLLLCHQLAKKIGAKIEVGSEINRGSEFSLIIPLNK